MKLPKLKELAEPKMVFSVNIRMSFNPLTKDMKRNLEDFMEFVESIAPGDHSPFVESVSLDYSSVDFDLVTTTIDNVKTLLEWCANMPMDIETDRFYVEIRR